MIRYLILLQTLPIVGCGDPDSEDGPAIKALGERQQAFKEFAEEMIERWKREGGESRSRPRQRTRSRVRALVGWIVCTARQSMRNFRSTWFHLCLTWE